MLKALLKSSCCPCIHKSRHFIVESNQVCQAVGKLTLSLPNYFLLPAFIMNLGKEHDPNPGGWWCSCLDTNTLANVFIVFLLSHFNTQKILSRSKSSLPLMKMIILPGTFCCQCWSLHNQLRMKYY